MNEGHGERREDRRGFVRVRERLVTFLKDPATGRVHRVLTRDLGGVGLCVVTEEKFDKWKSLEVELQMPDRKAPITFTGEVIWEKPTKDTKEDGSHVAMHEVGIKYVQIDPKDISFIKQHIAMNASPDF